MPNCILDPIRFFVNQLPIKRLLSSIPVYNNKHKYYNPRPSILPEKQLPWLIIPNNNIIYNLTNKLLYKLELPEDYIKQRRRICGSSHGWLAMVDESPLILLLNPFNKLEIILPPITTITNVLAYRPADTGIEYLLQAPSGIKFTETANVVKGCFVDKIILSGNPCLERYCIAIGIFGGKLHYCQVGRSARWIGINEDVSFSDIDDVVVWKDEIYVVSRAGELGVCDLKKPGLGRLRKLVMPFRNPSLGLHNYLVVSSTGDDLLLVCRELHNFISSSSTDNCIDHINKCNEEENRDDDDGKFYYHTVNFKIYKLNLSDRSWEIYDLGNDIIFLGTNTSMSLSAPDFRKQGNCIYFTDDNLDGFDEEGIVGGHDNGVFDVSTGNIELLPHCLPSYRWSFLPPPVWLVPYLS